MTDVVEIARKQLAELEAKAAELRTFLAVHASLTGGKPVDDDGLGDEYAATDAMTASPKEIVEGAKALMSELKRPLTRSQIVKLLTQKGLRLPGKDPSKNVGTVIWRSKQFDNVEGYGYWPKEFGGWLGQRHGIDASQLGINL